MRLNRIIVSIALPLVACGDADLSERVPREVPPAAAVLVPEIQSEPLSEQLDELAAELDRALGGEPERLLTAEALTDRLMQATRPVDWLGAGYDVEARLRQLQAMADRVVAMLRRGAELAAVQPDVETMRQSVEDLQAQMARAGGGPAPPTLDSLLAQDPLRDAQARSLRAVTGTGTAATASATPSAATPPRDSLPEPRIRPAGGPLGSPVRPPPDTSGRDR
jgi:hypothetical protein